MQGKPGGSPTRAKTRRLSGHGGQPRSTGEVVCITWPERGVRPCRCSGPMAPAFAKPEVGFTREYLEWCTCGGATSTGSSRGNRASSPARGSPQSTPAGLCAAEVMEKRTTLGVEAASGHRTRYYRAQPGHQPALWCPSLLVEAARGLRPPRSPHRKLGRCPGFTPRAGTPSTRRAPTAHQHAAHQASSTPPPARIQSPACRGRGDGRFPQARWSPAPTLLKRPVEHPLAGGA